MKKTVVSLLICAFVFTGFVSISDAKEPRMSGKSHFAFLKKMDKDGDGKISKDEYINSASDRFSKMDDDKDGFITQDEHEVHMEAKREEWKKMAEERKKEREEKLKNRPPMPDVVIDE